MSPQIPSDRNASTIRVNSPGRSALALKVATYLTGCGPAEKPVPESWLPTRSQPRANGSESAGELLHIRAALFVHLIKRYRPLYPKAKVFFLDVSEKPGTAVDPPPDLMALLHAHRAVIAPSSEADGTPTGVPIGVVHRVTRVPGLDLNAGAVEQKGLHATVLGGYYYSGRAAITARYRMKKVDGTWKVTGQEVLSRS